MRIKLVEEYSLDEFPDAISDMTETLKANGIESLRHITFYFQACSKRTQVKFINDGKEVDHLIFENGTLKQSEVQSGDFELVKAHEFKSTKSKKN